MDSYSEMSEPARRGNQKESYTQRLIARESVWWKKLFNVQMPYRWNLRRLKPGFMLDIGCGIGRNLRHMDGYGIGVDHNPHTVQVARGRGLKVFTPEEFQRSEFYSPDRFDSILLAHVAEHMMEDEVVSLLSQYLMPLKSGGQVIIITPQEYCFRSDPDHVQFMDFASLRRISNQLGLQFFREFSFPFPRMMGNIFKYNEFVSISKKP